jgi:hypothetical protein
VSWEKKGEGEGLRVFYKRYLSLNYHISNFDLGMSGDHFYRLYFKITWVPFSSEYRMILSLMTCK